MSEPSPRSRFTRLGRGLDPEAVTEYLDAVEAHLARAEARAMVLAAHADAAIIRRLAEEQVAAIRFEACVTSAALHERAMAEVERLQVGCLRLNRLLDDVDAALSARVDTASDIHFVVEPEAEAAVGSAGQLP